jgi:hypothetical protein
VRDDLTRKGQAGSESMLSIERFSGQTVCDSFSDEGFLYFLLPKTVAGLLKLVELWKGLVVVPCLISSVEMNVKL